MLRANRLGVLLWGLAALAACTRITAVDWTLIEPEEASAGADSGGNVGGGGEATTGEGGATPTAGAGGATDAEAAGGSGRGGSSEAGAPGDGGASDGGASP
jgi:hypothetical protein